MRRFLWALLATALASTAAQAGGRGHGRDHDGHDRGHGQNFVFVEESERLPADTSADGTSSTDVDLIDVDADGDLDLFVAEGTDSPAPRPNRLLLNDGDGYFTDVSATQLPPGVANSTKADWGDVDGDGDVDAIVANLGPEQLLLNDGHGTFADASAQLPPPVTLFANISSDARLADVDADGDLDILVANENPFNPAALGGAQNRIFINDGSAHFTDETADRLPAMTDQTGSIEPGDLDDDGDLDLVVVNRGQERALINDGDGFFTEETAARMPVTADTSRGGALGDLDGDCDLDLLVANSRGEPAALYFNDGHGFFHAVDFAGGAGGETSNGAILVDLDEDGDLDAYLPDSGAFSVGHGFAGAADDYFVNNGRGRFEDRSARHFPGLLDPTTDAAFGDIDGDGDLDLVVGNTGSGAFAVERVLIQHAQGEGHGHH